MARECSSCASQSEKVPRQRKARRGELSTLPARVALAGEPGNEIVFQALREWRKGVAKEHGVPAYTVFHDATLQEIARLLPDRWTSCAESRASAPPSSIAMASRC